MPPPPAPPSAGPAGATDPATHAAARSRAGLLFGLAAYGWWGVLPIYFWLLTHVPALTLVSHRIVWSIVLLAIILLLQRRLGEVARVFRSPRLLGLLSIAAIFIGVNWLVFIYAVNTEQVMQASLGYYINPLVSVLLGLVVLRERLRPLQWASVALAAFGVVLATLGAGATFPWISLTLACSFALYGLLRKLAPVGPMVGLLVETLILLPPALGVLVLLPLPDDAATPGTYAMLVLAGVVTALPLLWFAAAAQRLPLVTLGFLQYVGPSIQLVIAALLMGEDIVSRLPTFAFIWAALLVFTLDAARARRTPRAAQPVEMAE